MRLAIVLCWLAIAIPAGARPVADDALCSEAVATTSRKLGVSAGVLRAIALVESGRQLGGRFVPWPWSIDVNGVARVFATQAEAVAAVQALQAAGTRSIDVGCMQVNLAAHPDAFVSLEAAFDPTTNTEYAARWLRALTEQTGQLATAITAYHSHTPELAADYARRVLAVWPAAAQLGLAAALPEATAAPAPRRSGSAPATRVEVVSVHGAAWPQQSTLLAPRRGGRE